jgi:hypothetical protein
MNLVTMRISESKRASSCLLDLCTQKPCEGVGGIAAVSQFTAMRVHRTQLKSFLQDPNTHTLLAHQRREAAQHHILLAHGRRAPPCAQAEHLLEFHMVHQRREAAQHPHPPSTWQTCATLCTGRASVRVSYGPSAPRSSPTPTPS